MAKTPCGAESGAERLRRRRHVPPIAPGDVVAAEDDEIGLLAHQHARRRARTSSCDTSWLRWTSVINPMRSPASAGGRPATGTFSRVTDQLVTAVQDTRTHPFPRARRRPSRAES